MWETMGWATTFCWKSTTEFPGSKIYIYIYIFPFELWSRSGFEVPPTFRPPRPTIRHGNPTRSLTCHSFFFWNPTRSGSSIINIYTIYINLYLWGASRASSPVVMSRNTSRAPSRAPSQAPSRAPSCGPSGAATPEVGSPSAPTTWGFHRISRIYRPETWCFFFEGAASATCVTLGEVPPKCWNIFCSNKTLRSGNPFEQFLPWGYLMFFDWCMVYVWVKSIVTLNS